MDIANFVHETLILLTADLDIYNTNPPLPSTTADMKKFLAGMYFPMRLPPAADGKQAPA